MLERVKSVTILDNYTSYNAYDDCHGLKVEAFVPGTKLEFNPYFNLFIGDNGRGKTALISLIHSFFFDGFHYRKDRDGAYVEVDANFTEPINNDGTINQTTISDFGPAGFGDNEIRGEDGKVQIYSAGQTQRIRLNEFMDKRLGYGEPIFFDEPETSLDFRGRYEIARQIRDFGISTGRQVFVATHAPEFFDPAFLKTLNCRVFDFNSVPVKQYLEGEFDIQRDFMEVYGLVE